MVWKSEGKSGFDRIPLTNRLIVANRATHNKHEKELEALEKQILEMKARIASEQNGELPAKSRAKKQSSVFHKHPT